MKVNADKLKISEVKEGIFQEFIRVTGVVQPQQIRFLDVVEGGVISNIYLETGEKVSPGDTILVLSNSDLQLSVLQQESAIYDQINNVRSSRLALEQNRLDLKQELENARYRKSVLTPQYERQKSLYKQKLISRQQWEQIREEYKYQQKQYELSYESFYRDSLESDNQLEQLDRSEQRMYRSLETVQSILDNLVIRAPAGGQLTTPELNEGQSLQPGERVGQVDGQSVFKIQARIDEIRLSEVKSGMKAEVEIAGKMFNLRVSKIYPVIEEGNFKVDLEFTEDLPDEIKRGQSLNMKLFLGSTDQSLLLARGAYYRITGGKWIYKISGNGEKAIKEFIETGRANPEYFEIKNGLSAGDRVITSDYDTFGDNRELIFN